MFYHKPTWIEETPAEKKRKQAEEVKRETERRKKQKRDEEARKHKEFADSNKRWVGDSVIDRRQCRKLTTINSS